MLTPRSASQSPEQRGKWEPAGIGLATCKSVRDSGITEVGSLGTQEVFVFRGRRPRRNIPDPSGQYSNVKLVNDTSDMCLLLPRTGEGLSEDHRGKVKTAVQPLISIASGHKP